MAQGREGELFQLNGHKRRSAPSRGEEEEEGERSREGARRSRRARRRGGMRQTRKEHRNPGRRAFLLIEDEQ